MDKMKKMAKSAASKFNAQALVESLSPTAHNMFAQMGKAMAEDAGCGETEPQSEIDSLRRRLIGIELRLQDTLEDKSHYQDRSDEYREALVQARAVAARQDPLLREQNVALRLAFQEKENQLMTTLVDLERTKAILESAEQKLTLASTTIKKLQAQVKRLQRK